MMKKKFASTTERVTPIGLALFNVLSKIKKPLTVHEILVALEKKGITANKTTVYRQLENLQKNQLVNEVHFNDRNVRYELNEKDSHHHHLVCIKCKKVEDVDLPNDLHQQEAMVLKKNKFKVLKHFLEFFGHCQSCQK